MERVARISKLTIDNFEQMLMTFEGLTYEENTPEILSALKILQEQLNKRVMELDVSYKVEEPVEELEEEYSEDFINALANEFIKNGTVRFLTQPSPKLVDLVQERVQEIKNNQEKNQPASVQDELISKAPVETPVELTPVAEAPVGEPVDLAPVVETPVEAPVELTPVAEAPEDAPVELTPVAEAPEEATAELNSEEPVSSQAIDPKIIEELAQQFIVVGSLKFLSNPSKELVDAINARVRELREEQIKVSTPDSVVSSVDEVQTELNKEEQHFDPKYIDELAHQVIEKGGLRFLSKPPEGLLEAVNARVTELREEQIKVSTPDSVVSSVDEVQTELNKEEQHFDSAYIDELAQQMISTGKVTFMAPPPEGLMEVVNNRVAEIKSMMVQDELVETPSYDQEQIDFLAQEVIRTGKLNFVDIPPEGLMTAINNRVIELRELESQKDSVVTK